MFVFFKYPHLSLLVFLKLQSQVCFGESLIWRNDQPTEDAGFILHKCNTKYINYLIKTNQVPNIFQLIHHWLHQSMYVLEVVLRIK